MNKWVIIASNAFSYQSYIYDILSWKEYCAWLGPFLVFFNFFHIKFVGKIPTIGNTWYIKYTVYYFTSETISINSLFTDS